MMPYQRQAGAAKFNVPFSSSDAMDVITHPDVDAVWICSPSQYHADQVSLKTKMHFPIWQFLAVVLIA